MFFRSESLLTTTATLQSPLLPVSLRTTLSSSLNHSPLFWAAPAARHPPQGADRAGKTTQCTNLTKYLQEAGHRVELWRFPDRETQIGKMINGYLTNGMDLSDQAVRLPRSFQLLS